MLPFLSHRAALAGLLLLAVPAAAQTVPPVAQTVPPVAVPAPPKAALTGIDPAVTALFKEVMPAHQKLSAFTATITVDTHGPAPSYQTVTLACRKPGSVSATLAGKTGLLMRLVSDGKTVTTYDVHAKKYRVAPISAADPVLSVLGATRSLIALLYGKPALLNMLLTQKGVSASLGSPETFGGMPMEVVNAVQAMGNDKSQITLAFGADDHLLRRLTIVQISATQPTAVPVTLTETVTALSTAPTLTAADFTFTPDEGVTKDAKDAEVAEVAQEPPMHDPRLVPGARPFTVTAKDLNGKLLTLAQYKGKVVLMDFWATWCGPCVGEMPNVQAVYKKYHAQGFEIVGVSLDQSRPALMGFIAQNKMPWRQVFDGKGWGSAVPREYGVQSIPFGLLIGRDGKIAAVDVRGPALTEAVQEALTK